MILASKREEVMNNLEEILIDSLEKYIEVHDEDFGKLPYETAVNKVHDAIKAAFPAVLAGTEYEGYVFPGILTDFMTFATEDGQHLYAVEVSYKTKLKVRTPYKVKRRFTTENFLENAAQMFLKTAMYLLDIMFAEENIDALNERLALLFRGQETTTTFSAALSLENRFVVDVSDGHVIFAATLETAKNIPGFTIMSDVRADDDFSKFAAKREGEAILGCVKTCNPPQLMKSGAKVIQEITGIKTKKRADKLLRETYHNNAELFFKRSQKGVAYFEKKVEDADGVQTMIFALLEKKDGELTVKLSPFDESTNFTVDFDVLDLMQ